MPERRALALSVPVQPGDSGGPVIDATAQIRGIVTQRTPAGAIAERATEVRLLLESAGVTPGEGESAPLFRDAMEAFWRLDFAAARRGLRRDARRLRRSHAGARRGGPRGGARRGHVHAERGPAAEPAAGDRDLAAVAALACGLALARPVLTARGRGTTRR